MESVPLGSDPDQRELNELLTLFDAPAYIRRARQVEHAYTQLLDRARRQREEWLLMVRLNLGRLHALAGGWEALRPWMDADQQPLLEQLWRDLSPRLRMPLRATTSPRPLRKALRELLDSLERFNTRWRAYLVGLDRTTINELREGYNRYYVLEKACALRSDTLARLQFAPLPPLQVADLEAALPPLPVPCVRLG
ncbi:MAG: hypothetical protein U0840_17800 [Gemmataceae bacterium]